MKKRVLILCLASAFVLSFAACGQQEAPQTQETGDAANGQQAGDQALNTQEAPEEAVSAEAEQTAQEEPDAQESDAGEDAQQGSDDADAGSVDETGSFWGSTMIATSVSDNYASIRDAYIDGGSLVIDGTYNIETEDGEVEDISDAGVHSFPLSGNAAMGSMGGTEEPDTMSVDVFNETLQYDVVNNPGLGLVFYVENGVVQEVWITS